MKLLKTKILNKKLLASLLLLSSGAVSANPLNNSTPIEPVLVPLQNIDKSIDIHIGKYEVTIAEFTRFANATGYQGSKKCYLYSPTSLPHEESGS